MKILEIKQYLKDRFPNINEKEMIEVSNFFINEINTARTSKRGILIYIGECKTYKNSMYSRIFHIKTDELCSTKHNIVVRGDLAKSFDYELGDSVRIEFDIVGGVSKDEGYVFNNLELTKIERIR